MLFFKEQDLSIRFFGKICNGFNANNVGGSMSDVAVNQLQLSLQQLMTMKSRRDDKKFTIYQFAKELGMPHSMLVKLLHADPEKRVHNPRIETLARIVAFFNRDGFQITIDDLLQGTVSDACVDVASQPVPVTTMQSVPLRYVGAASAAPRASVVSIPLAFQSLALLAVVSDQAIEPIFKAGSLFIVDQHKKAEVGHLYAAVRRGKTPCLVVGLYQVDASGHTYLTHINDIRQESIQLADATIESIGVVVQVDAKT